MPLLPGVLAAFAVMAAGFWLADALGQAFLAAQGLTGGSPISGVPVAIVLGLLARNLFTLPAALAPGIKFATTTVLRAGIVLVGIRLSLFDVARLGLAGLPVVIAAIVTGLVFVTWLNRRMGLPPRLGTLLAAGTSICGVTAIVSTAPAIDADEREVAYAVANVVLFGLLGMLAYPYLAHALLARPETVGLFLGTAVHDTSQVMGAALTYQQLYADDVALRTAAVTKLTRNLFLAVVIPVLTWMHARERAGGEAVRSADVRSGGAEASADRSGPGGDRSAPRSPSPTRYIPGFVLGFLAMALVRTIGDAMLGQAALAYGLFDAQNWKAVTDLLGDTLGSRALLGTAMAGVGLGTSFTVFRGVGLKPFIVGFAGAAAVAAVGLAMALTFGRFVTL